MDRQTHTNLLQGYKKKYESARYSLLIVILFTLVNSIMLICGSESYFLFSAQFLYFILFLAKLLVGKMPADYYDPNEPIEPLPDAIYIGAIVIVVIALAVYFLCWLKSKDLHYNWIIASLVLFCIDVALSFITMGFSIDNIIDYLFAAYVIYSIAVGIKAQANIKKLPEPIDPPAEPAEDDFGFAERDFSYNDGNGENTEKKEDTEETFH